MASASVPVSVHVNTPPGIIVNPTSLDFGSMDVGETKERFFDISADSLRSLSNVDAVIAGSFTGTAGITASISANPAALPVNLRAGEALRITVAFTASAPGDYDFDVDVSTD